MLLYMWGEFFTGWKKKETHSFKSILLPGSYIVLSVINCVFISKNNEALCNGRNIRLDSYESVFITGFMAYYNSVLRHADHDKKN
ncbi:hypothetical protein ABVU48_004111 [Salmonella enterica]